MTRRIATKHITPLQGGSGHSRVYYDHGVGKHTQHVVNQAINVSNKLKTGQTRLKCQPRNCTPYPFFIAEYRRDYGL